jgi:hypothetical protein
MQQGQTQTAERLLNEGGILIQQLPQSKKSQLLEMLQTALLQRQEQPFVTPLFQACPLPHKAQ